MLDGVSADDVLADVLLEVLVNLLDDVDVLAFQWMCWCAMAAQETSPQDA